MPFPPQAPQGPMGFGQPRPPLMGYGGKSCDCGFFLFFRNLWKCARSITPFQQVHHLTPQTSMVEEEEEEGAGETMTTSEDRAATSASHVTSGKNTAGGC